MRKAVRVLALLMVPLFLTGCWSYIGLNDIAIVMGLGLDEDPASGGYQVTAEIVDFTKSLKESAPTGKLVVSSGTTVFEALRDAKRKLINKLYFSNAQIIAFSEAVARDKGILDAGDWILRDSEGRETINLLVVKGGTAKDLLAIKGLDQSIVSSEIDAIITEDAKVTSSTAHTELYTAYDILNSPGIELTLPAFIIADNDGQKVAQAEGIAAFKGDKLAGYLSKDESKFFLMATNACHGGILALAMHGTGAPDTSLEIQNSKEKTSFEAQGDSLSFRVETETNVFLAETQEDIDVLKDDQIQALEEEAGKRLEIEIATLIQKVQRELGTDIFGFGELVYQRDPKKWHSFESRWGEIFPTLPVTVKCKVNIVNTAFITTKEAIKP
jgi:spore germination protein KC